MSPDEKMTLQARIDALTDLLKINTGKTQADREAKKAAWNERSKLLIALNGPMPRTSYSSRAGKRSAAERRALHRR